MSNNNKRPTPLPNFKVQKYIKDHRLEDGDDQERNWRCWSLKVGGGSSSIVGSASSLHHPAPSSGNLFDISPCNLLLAIVYFLTSFLAFHVAISFDNIFQSPNPIHQLFHFLLHILFIFNLTQFSPSFFSSNFPFSKDLSFWRSVLLDELSVEQT